MFHVQGNIIPSQYAKYTLITVQYLKVKTSVVDPELNGLPDPDPFYFIKLEENLECKKDKLVFCEIHKFLFVSIFVTNMHQST
jgi:hypothetical protein